MDFPALYFWAFWILLFDLQSIRRVEVDIFALFHVLAYDVGGFFNFSDWPATTTFLANCGGAFLR